VITDADSPAADPKNPASAGAKSPVDIPCRYINGNTSVTFGERRAHGVRIEDRNRQRSPESSTRRSFTLGAATSIGPAAVVTVRDSARPLRTTNRWASVVALVGQRGDVGVYFGFEGSRQHPAGTIQDDLIEHRTHVGTALVIGHYCQHRRSFLAGAPTPAELVLVQRGRYVASPNEPPDTQVQVIPLRPPWRVRCRRRIAAA